MLNWDRELTRRQKELLERYYQLVLQGNQEQNLTRITTPEEFVELNLKDVGFFLDHIQWQGPALDLGSGPGIPGIPAAILNPNPWVLAESEKRKAEFLVRAVKELGLSSQVQVFSGRAEDWLKKNQVEMVVSRAVGSVSRMMEWIGNCSTWNKLVLFKSLGWNREWEEFQRRKNLRSKLKLAQAWDYQVGPPSNPHQHKLVLLKKCST